MGDWSTPAITDPYANFRQAFDDRSNDVAKGNDPATTTVTNPPTNMLRWNSASKYWEKYNGTAWVVMSTLYAINISGNAATATTAAAVPWAGITGKPTTISGYGITDAVRLTASNQTINGNLIVAGYLKAYGAGGTTGYVYLNSGGSRYMGFNGTNYLLPGAQLIATTPTQSPGDSSNNLASTAYVDAAVASATLPHGLGSTGYQDLPGGIRLQWGSTGNIAGIGSATITFPSAFGGTVWNVQITGRTSPGTAQSHDYVDTISSTSFLLHNNASNTCAYYWTAIGPSP